MSEAIFVEGLTKAYGGKTVVDHLDLSVQSGTVFGLLGANGAGKSTTIECVCLAQSRPIAERFVRWDRIRKGAAVRFLSALTCSFRRAAIIERSGSPSFARKPPVSTAPPPIGANCVRSSVSVIRHTAVKNLSGGERQRLFIVLALIGQPELVFLDELTTGLDAKARRGVWKTLETLKEQGLTIFLTSHFMDEVEALCDEICILKQGTPVFGGTVEQAKRQCGRQRFEDAYLQLSSEEADA